MLNENGSSCVASTLMDWQVVVEEGDFGYVMLFECRVSRYKGENLGLTSFVEPGNGDTHSFKVLSVACPEFSLG